MAELAPISVQVSTDEVLEVVLARAGQAHAELLAEIGRITVYARQLQARVAELEALQPAS
jgi:hypothetical protein